MSDRPNNPAPAPLSEDQLLDWVEGRLSAADEARIAAASGRSGLAERVAQMQANRRALQSLGDVAAPRDLMDRVGAALEREALIGLVDGDAVDDHPPISLVVPERRWRINRAAAGFALAAGVVLMVVGAVYFTGAAFTGPKKTSPLDPGPIALNTNESGVETMELRGTQAPEAGTDAAASMKVADAGAEPAAAMMAVPAPAGPIDPQRALALAAEGRLAIRVYARSTRNLEQIEAATQPGVARSWTMTSEVPAQVAAAVMPVNQTFNIGAPRDMAAANGRREAMRQDVTRQALTRQALTMVGPGGAMTWPMSITIDRLSRVKGTYLIDSPDSERMLAAIKNAFASRLDAEVVFEELPEPLDLAPTVDPERVLWWTNAPSEWTRRVQIPVVVEER